MSLWRGEAGTNGEQRLSGAGEAREEEAALTISPDLSMARNWPCGFLRKGGGGGVEGRQASECRCLGHRTAELAAGQEESRPSSLPCLSGPGVGGGGRQLWKLSWTLVGKSGLP